MNNFIETLKKRLNSRKPVRKADPIQEKEEIEKADPDAGEGSPDVISEVLQLIQNGELEPDVEAVEHHLMGMGMDEAEAESNAKVIVDTYLSETDVEKSDMAEDETVEKADMEAPAEDEAVEKAEAYEQMEEEPEKALKAKVKKTNMPPVPKEGLEKSIYGINKKINESNEAISVMLKSFMAVLDELESLKVQNSNLMKTVQKAGLTPVTKKAVTTKSNFGQVQSKRSHLDRLADGVATGKVSVEDVSLYEITGQLSEKANKFLRGNK